MNESDIKQKKEKETGGGGAFLRDVSLASIGPLVAKLKGVILVPVITKWIGAEAFGVWKQFAITSGFIAILATVGTAQVIHRYLSPMERPEKYSGHFFAIAVFVFGAASMAAGALALFPGVASERIFGQGASRAPLYLLVAYLPILAVSNRLATFLKARRKFNVTAPFSVLRNLGSIILTTVLIFWTGDVTAAIAGYVAWNFGGLIVLFQLARRRADLEIVWPDFSTLKKYLAFGGPLVLVTVGSRLAEFGDRYIIVNLLGIEEAGIYSVAYAGGAIGVLLLKPLSQVLLPDFSVLVEQGKQGVLKRRLTSVVKYFVASQIGIMVLLFFLGEPVIAVLSTEAFLEALPVLKVIPIGIAAFGMLQIGSQVLNAEERTRIVGLIWFGVGALNIAANIIAIPLFGLLGAGIATVVSYAAGAAGCWWCVQRQYPIKLTGRAFVGTVVASLSAVCVLLLVTASGGLGPLLTLLLGGSMGAAAYAGGLVLAGFVTEKEQRLLSETIGAKYARFLRTASLRQ